MCGAVIGRWRPAFTSLQVVPLDEPGARRLLIVEDGHRITFDLNPDQAGALADLLREKEEIERGLAALGSTGK